ncbi:hypothetical protein appser9_7630 [Actinobacillus pleuropneumoniae serovar 9 str. CVJ13261]|nr:hypothetical protein appser9_7630 [Actinobacillus pleuropneumoniae serovar 9 str. CVJ13261]
MFLKTDLAILAKIFAILKVLFTEKLFYQLSLNMFKFFSF